MNKATIYDFARMCNNFNFDCSECPLHLSGRGMCYDCGEFIIDLTDKANEIILNWCKEHPATTRQSELLEMFPNVALVDCEFINICPKDIDIQYGADCNNQSCRDCKKEYWLAGVEENE